MNKCFFKFFFVALLGFVAFSLPMAIFAQDDDTAINESGSANFLLKDLIPEIERNKSKDSAVALEIILDSSRNMKIKIDEMSIMEIFKKDISKFLISIPANTEVALRSFGHRYGTRKSEESCKDSVLLSPFMKVDSIELKKSINALNTKGYSALAYSIDEISQDVTELESEKKLVVLIIAAGTDSCGGDVYVSTKELKKMRPEVMIHAINLFGDAKVQEELVSITDITNGKVYDVTQVNELEGILKNLTKDILAANGDEEEDDEINLADYEMEKEFDSTNEVIEKVDLDDGGDSGDGGIGDDTNGAKDDDIVNQMKDSNEGTALKIYDFLNSKLFLYGAIGVGIIILIIIVTLMVVRKKESVLMPTSKLSEQANAQVISKNGESIPHTDTPMIKTEKTPKTTDTFNLGDIKQVENEEVSLDKMIEPEKIKIIKTTKTDEPVLPQAKPSKKPGIQINTTSPPTEENK